MDIEDAKYMLFTSFRRDGTPVATPVWSVPMGAGRLGFSTGSDSGKVKRLAHTDRVTVQPCDARGKPKSGTEPTEATAHTVSGHELDEIRRRIGDKYRIVSRLIRLWDSIGGVFRRSDPRGGDVGVIVEL